MEIYLSNKLSEENLVDDIQLVERAIKQKLKTKNKIKLRSMKDLYIKGYKSFVFLEDKRK